jgi:hypothetical protein
MGEMAERVARQLRTRGGLIAPDEMFTKLARAAIEAMREPTQAMADKGGDQFDWGPSGYYDAPQGSAYPEGVWRVMIDAALAELTER